MADAEQPALCTYQPLPGEILKGACQECGHAFVLHVGVEHCPVCELVQHNRQAREASVTFEQVVSGEKSINAYRAARDLPPHPDATVTVHVEGRVIDEGTLRDSVEKSMRRYGQGRA